MARQLNVLRPDFPNNPDEWNTEQVLYTAAQHVTDPPSAFSLGFAGVAKLRTKTAAPFALIDRLTHYDKLTADIGKTLSASSSADGEQPKFIAEISGDANRAHQHFIVKFSPPHDTPFGVRWRSLLHLEKLALDTLREHNIAAAASTIVESAARTYLESQRFDRFGLEGKRHVVAIDSLHAEFVGGARQNWIHTCEKLVAKKCSRLMRCVPWRAFTRSVNTLETLICTLATYRFLSTT